MTDERDRYLGIGKYIHPLNRRDRGIPPRKAPLMETVTITASGQEWPILPDCTAPTHNTLRARRNAKGSNRCGCPGAMAAYREYRANRPPDDPERVAYRKGLQPKPKAPGAVRRKMPSFRYGTCTTPQGRIVSNEAFSTDVTVTGFAARDRAKAQCALCPILEECLDWITGEREQGEYGGVYAGLDIWDRQGRPQRLDANGKVEAVPRAAE